MSGTERIHHIAISIRSEGLSKLLLAGFHSFFSFIISRIFFIDTYRLTFFLSIETEVLKHEHFAHLERISHLFSLSAIRSKFYFLYAQSSSYSILNLSQAVFSIHLAFGFTHMAHDNERTTFIEDMLQGRYCTANTGVIGNFTILIEGYIEVHADNCLFSGKFVIVDSHNINNLIVCYLLISKLFVTYSFRAFGQCNPMPETLFLYLLIFRWFRF